ncbi:hypothetical protein C8Q77DRAFT_1216522 [Trametes polyzona]|nr:hypothetical protein C8Q77DRAFT_1216522 [Trametes polyzona]
MSVTVREVPAPSDEELNQYAKLLAESFGYQFFAGGLGGDKSLQEPMMLAHLAAAVVNGAGEIHIAELPEAGVAGVAVWFGPGHKFLESEAQRNAGWNQLMDRLEPKYREWWSTFLAQYDALVERSLGPGVKIGAYHLQLIGVAPDHQKKGIATALTTYAESKAHAVKVPSVLETAGPTNVAVYKALQYEVAGSGPIQAPPPSEGTFEMFVFIKHTEEAKLEA